MSNNLNWYILYILGGQEKKILKNISLRTDMVPFLPMAEYMIRKNGTFSIVEKILFPNYLFISTDMDASTFQKVLLTIKKEQKGIIKELKYAEQISALTDEEKNTLERLMDEKAVIRRSEGWIEGERVIITQGPLQGYESDIIWIDRHKRMAKLNIQLLNRSIEVKVALEIMKKIEL